MCVRERRGTMQIDAIDYEHGTGVGWDGDGGGACVYVKQGVSIQAHAQRAIQPMVLYSTVMQSFSVTLGRNAWTQCIYD